MTDVIIVTVRQDKAGQPRYHVHAAGCADLRGRRADKYRMEDAWPVEASSLSQVAQMIYPPDSFDYDPATDLSYEGDVKVLPCVGWES